MRVNRIKLFSKLPDSRIGIGWVQDKNDKVKSEKYFEAAKKAADDSFDKDGDSEKAVKKSKSAAAKKVVLDEAPEPIGKAVGYGALAYGATRFPEYINKAMDYHPDTRNLPKIPIKAVKFLKSHSGKIASAVALGNVIYHVPRIKRKVDAAKTGAEINTRDRIKKYNKKENKE